ncbi:hypothetical protein DV738_g298, partial [Chaetothyriales sp. CBS 135597]
MGPVSPGAQLSQNHWSIYLLVVEGGSVRLNIEADTGPGEDWGVFKISRHLYELTVSNVRYWDFPVASSIAVGKILALIWDKKRHRYRMNSTGVGCRYWVLTIISDFVEAGYCDENAATTLAESIEFNYSRNQQPIALPMIAGTFY